MRVKNSFFNSVSGIASNIIAIVFGFLAQTVFIRTLGVEYLGLNSIMLNLVSMLSIVELGVGNQIVFLLYKPIAENNILQIRKLMNFYKSTYRYIALSIFVIGLTIMPFINKIIGGSDISYNVYLIFFLFIIEVSVSYLASYKRSILYANQNNRMVDFIHILYTFVLNLAQILILLNTSNYILYLLVKILCRILENIAIDTIAGKIYKEIFHNNSEKIDKKDFSFIVSRIKALFLHQIGGYIVLNTDGLIISNILGLTVAGLYANYFLISNSINILLSQIFNSMTGSVGNMLVQESSTKSYDIFKKMFFINFVLFLACSVAIGTSINHFIYFWIGKKYVLPQILVGVLCLNFFSQGLRKTMQTYASAAGICFENRFVPIIESVVNLVFSVLLAYKFGLSGVIMGTFLSSLVLHLYSFPKFIFKPLFERERTQYVKLYLTYLILGSMIYLVTVIGFDRIVLANNFIGFLLKSSVSMITSIMIIIVLFRGSSEFRFYKNMLSNAFGKIRNLIKS